MRYALIAIAALAATSCGSSDPVTPTAPPVQTCQANNTATVYFQNRSTTGLTYDVIWDGTKLTTVGPSQDSQTYTFAANVSHALSFQYTNTTVLACNPSTPILATCSAVFYGCSG